MKTSSLQCYLFVAISVFLTQANLAHAKSPNIVFIVADDLGWNDVGFHNPDMITPNIDKLAREGVILNQSYVQPLCSPSRNSFLSGIYPFKSGLQHMVILPVQAVCAPLNFTFLPQKLKSLGYATHAIGKWHLGFCKWECTPTYRGFDTFYGYYNGAEDYYSHVVLNGTDFRDNKEAVRTDGEYSANLYARRAGQIIAKHNTSQPLFLYLPFQSVHQPIQVPKKYENLYSKIQNDGRRQYSGMVSALDEAIGNVTLALKQKGIYNDTLIIFTTDNGGWPVYYGNNYPLRGSKVTVFEGGTRAAAFVHGAGLQKNGIIYDGMMHAVDWMPTIVSAAGGSTDISAIDGIDQWTSISEGSVSSRTEFIYNLDDSAQPKQGHAAIRVNDFKLIQGYPGPYIDWYKPQSAKKDYVIKQAPINEFDGVSMLFNIKDDPNEHNDLSKSHPDIVKQLQTKMEEYKKQMVPANFPGVDPKSDPKNYGGFWSPGWC